VVTRLSISTSPPSPSNVPPSLSYASTRGGFAPASCNSVCTDGSMLWGKEISTLIGSSCTTENSPSASAARTKLPSSKLRMPTRPSVGE
jgi:hypothetical protein